MSEELKDIKQRVTKLEEGATELEDIKTELSKLKATTEKYSNSAIARDLRINGIPYTTNEDLGKIFGKICNNLNINTPPIQCIYRTQNKNAKRSSPDTPILVKHVTPHDKNFILKSINHYKKEHKYLNLSSLGFQMQNKDQGFYIHENLTSGNFRILREAIGMKKHMMKVISVPVQLDDKNIYTYILFLSYFKLRLIFLVIFPSFPFLAFFEISVINLSTTIHIALFSSLSILFLNIYCVAFEVNCVNPYDYIGDKQY